MSCRTSPPQGGRSDRRSRPCLKKGFNFKPCTDDRKRAADPGPISPLEGEMPGKAEGGEPHGKTSPS
ncbi:hypothetical protein FS800_10630 [Agrobacterium vitis]|nr:hypothetical protein [Allorhizobium ampelinum]